MHGDCGDVQQASAQPKQDRVVLLDLGTFCLWFMIELHCVMRPGDPMHSLGGPHEFVAPENTGADGSICTHSWIGELCS